jgi:hypothetical protein
MTHVRRFFCGLHGHDALLHFEHAKLSLQCTSCGFETPGWDLQTKALRSEIAIQKPRLRLLPMFRERRVA